MTTELLPDWGFVLLLHDGAGWTVRHQNGKTLWRNTELGPDESTAARQWLADVMVEHVEITPVGMGDAADMYGIQVYDGRVQARPVGGLGRDEQGWMLVDGHGHITERAEGIDPHDETGANAWAERYYQSRTKRRRWRANVGVFPDGSYGDVHGVLGRQRLQRAWNWALDRLGL